MQQPDPATRRAMRTLQLRQRHMKQMQSHVEGCLPQEACGLLSGRAGVVHEVLTITNELRSPTEFRMAPEEQLRAFAAIENKGLELVGIFHSHPAARQTSTRPVNEPSESDIAAAAYPVVNVLWSRADDTWEAKGYWIEDGEVTTVELDTSER